MRSGTDGSDPAGRLGPGSRPLAIGPSLASGPRVASASAIRRVVGGEDEPVEREMIGAAHRCRGGGMADAADSKSAEGNLVGVRIPLPVPRSPEHDVSRQDRPVMGAVWRTPPRTRGPGCIVRLDGGHDRRWPGEGPARMTRWLPKRAILAAVGATAADLYEPRTNGSARASRPSAHRRRWRATWAMAATPRTPSNTSASIPLTAKPCGGSGTAAGRWTASKATNFAIYAAGRLPERTDELVVVAEGEQAADALVAAGLLAVGTVFGAPHAPSAAALEALRGRPIVLWADADASGRPQMAGIAALLAGDRSGAGHRQERSIP